MVRLLLRSLALVAAIPCVLPAQAAPRPVTLAEALTLGRGAGVQGALARLAAATVDARRAQRAGDFLPAVTGLATASRQTVNLREFGLELPGAPAVTDPFTLFRARLSATQLLFDPAVFERLRAARDTAVAAGLDAHRAGDLAAATAGAAWLRLASAEETVRARLADSATAAALAEIASAQVAAGTAARIERTRSETQVAALRVRLAVARNAVDRARLDLARALDLPPAGPLAIAGDPAVAIDGLPADAAGAVTYALGHRTDLAAERARRDVSVRTLRAIRREFIPSLGLQGMVQSSGVRAADLAGSWSLGVGLTWNLFDGFRRERRADEQRIRVDAATLRLRDLEAQIEADARQAMLDLASAGEQVTLAADQVRLAEQELAEARERLAAGVAGSVETTNAQAGVTAARDLLIQARVSLGAAQVGAARALGLLDQVH